MVGFVWRGFVITKNRKIFATADEYLTVSNDLGNIRNLTDSLDQINKLLDKYSPEFTSCCHCGAIDYASDTLVLYCNSNAIFHRINNQLPYIRDYLESNYINFHKILVKVKPANYRLIQKSDKKYLTDQEKAVLLKFAKAINRYDLITTANNEELELPNDYEFAIKL